MLTTIIILLALFIVALAVVLHLVMVTYDSCIDNDARMAGLEQKIDDFIREYDKTKDSHA